MPTYVSRYPTQDANHVKSTSQYLAQAPFLTTDPTKSLTGADGTNAWQTGAATNQRFHIDLGVPKIIKRIYYENAHSSGGSTTRGAKTFTLWGSNIASAFAELTYATDTNWTQITTAAGSFDQHVGADQADPKYILVTNSTAYRYYAFKFADNYGDGMMGVRRIELQVDTAYGEDYRGAAFLGKLIHFKNN